MDLLSIVKTDTSNNIHKRLSPESTEDSADTQYDSANPTPPKTAHTNTNRSDITTPDVVPPPSTSQVPRPARVDKSVGVEPLPNEPNHPSSTDALVPVGNGVNVPTYTPTGDSTITWAKELDKWKNQKDWNTVEGDMVKFMENYSAALLKGSSELSTYSADAFRFKGFDSLSVKRAHINFNPKMLGSYYMDPINMVTSKTSTPTKRFPWAEKLEFMKGLPKLTDASRLLDLTFGSIFDKKVYNLFDLAKSKNEELKLVQKNLNKSEPDTSMNKVNPDTGTGIGHGKDDIKWDISNESKWNERYINNKEIGPYFKGYSDISMFEGRIDRFYDFELSVPSSLKNQGLPAIPMSASGLYIDKASDLTSVTSIKLDSGETIALGEFGSPIKSIKLSGNVASISTDIYETEDIAVRNWLQSYITYMYGDNPTPLLHRSIYLGYYYITFYYLDVDRSIIIQRTFYGVPQFDLSLTPEVGGNKKFTIDWQIIGETN